MENARFSIEFYLRDNYSTTTVRYEGMTNFDKEKVGEWVELHLLGPVGQPARIRNQKHQRFILRTNCFSYIDIDPGAAANRKDLRRINAIVDAVTSALERKSINYQNTSGTNLGWLKTEEATVVRLPQEENLQVRSVDIPISLIRTI